MLDCELYLDYSDEGKVMLFLKIEEKGLVGERKVYYGWACVGVLLLLLDEHITSMGDV